MRTTNRLRERLIDIDEVAGRLGVSTRYVRRLVAERRIAYLKVGRLLRFDTDVVDAWLAACGVAASEGGMSSSAKSAQRSADSQTAKGGEPRTASTARNAKARQSR